MTINITKEAVMKHLQFLLILAILGLLVWSRPWDTASSSEQQRTITVNGEATIEAVPDEFVFYPYFEKSGTDRDALRDELTTQANSVVDGVKALGVDESKIRLDASSYDRWYWEQDEEGTMTISLTITLDNRELAQQVQDILLPLDNIRGQLTPQAIFSDGKQKELDAQAVEEASKDARAKAEAQAQLFGAELGDVVTINQSDNFGFPITLEADLSARAEEGSAASLPVLPGENEFRKTISVVYELK